MNSSRVKDQVEEPMLSFKHGTKVGGCPFIQHQTKETMATVLLAWQGKDCNVLRKSILASYTKTSYPCCHKNMTVIPSRVTLQEKESVFLLDDKRISEINMVSGRTKKRTPKLHPLLNSVVTMASSQNGNLNL